VNRENHNWDKAVPDGQGRRFLYGDGCTKYRHCGTCREKDGCQADFYFGQFVHKEHIRLFKQTGIKVWGKKVGAKI